MHLPSLAPTPPPFVMNPLPDAWSSPSIDATVLIAAVIALTLVFGFMLAWSEFRYERLHRRYVALVERGEGEAN